MLKIILIYSMFCFYLYFFIFNLIYIVYLIIFYLKSYFYYGNISDKNFA